jgi:hypothetical protein
MTVAYRNLDAVVEERIVRFRARRAAERPADDCVKRVFAARKARIAAGAVGLATGLALFVWALGSLHSLQWMGRECEATNTYILVGAWLALGISGELARGLARRRARLELGREPVASGDTHTDLARIDAEDPLRELRCKGSKLEGCSTALPLAAASLLAPLTLHGLVATALCWANRTSLTAADFGGWIAASALLVGLAHLALLVQVVLWGRSLRGRETSRLRHNIHIAWARTLAVTTGAALVPAIVFAPGGNLLVLLPAALVAATGLAFVPWLFVFTARRLEQERAALGGWKRSQLHPMELPQLRHL